MEAVVPPPLTRGTCVQTILDILRLNICGTVGLHPQQFWNSRCMVEVPLARLWELPDGTTCLLLKDTRVANWEVRVIRAGDTIRHERFGNPIIAMQEGKLWRASYDPTFEAAS